jgi:hypothetical protein
MEVTSSIIAKHLSFNNSNNRQISSKAIREVVAHGEPSNTANPRENALTRKITQRRGILRGDPKEGTGVNPLDMEGEIEDQDLAPMICAAVEIILTTEEVLVINIMGEINTTITAVVPMVETITRVFSSIITTAGTKTTTTH